MKRMVLVLTVALVMAAMVVAMATPGFAAPNTQANQNGHLSSDAEPGEKGTGTREIAPHGQQGETARFFANPGEGQDKPFKDRECDYTAGGGGAPGKPGDPVSQTASCTTETF